MTPKLQTLNPKPETIPKPLTLNFKPRMTNRRTQMRLPVTLEL
jgi:hypothetical protein